MTAAAQPADSQQPQTAATGLSPELEEVIVEIAHSERALDELIDRADRMHRSNIHHGPGSCLVCFAEQ
ncbi:MULTISPECIES: hypothetical protein [Nocardioides]|uniref:Uncharacterized protein n=1 Tax=Nocardioides vastitatis TaxID=2568655 RepID=A0ABW0ZCZ0_9ACTN|nr:hypothetical protein [Nocardioides sp.]THI96545.1 hypothetical protein E7Z54_16670 [Nocardioides sp.]